MRRSSFVILGLVLLTFAGIQAWVVSRAFFAPRTFTAVEAVIQGETIGVRTPVQAEVTEVIVHDGQEVTDGQVLFVLRRLSTDLTALGQPASVEIRALRGGIATDVSVSVGQLVQSDQLLALVIDGGPEALHVQARLQIEPGDVSALHPLMIAMVQAPFLNGGRAIEAVVTSIDPVYDARQRTIDVRLRLLTIPADLPRSLGLPVQAFVTEKDRSASDGNVMAESFRSSNE
jgi:multidrug resistance efflux pump